MNQKEKDREELECLVDIIELDNWNAEFEKSKVRVKEAGAELNMIPDQ